MTLRDRVAIFVWRYVPFARHLLDREPRRPPSRVPRRPPPPHPHDETTMRVSEDGERTQCQVCGSWHFTDPERQARLDRGEW